MALSGSCSRCDQFAAILSPSGLCLECEATDHSAGATPRLPAPGDPAQAPTATAIPEGSTRDEGAVAMVALPTAPPGYDLEMRLGVGGMGVVYLARELDTQREVAMKFIHFPGDPDAYDRFRIELRALAQLDHPNVIRVLASDLRAAAPYFTMEHLPNGSLTRAVADGKPLPVADAVQIVRTVAGALVAAHEKGIIHRDIKPSNILLAADGTPKLSDFGLAKRLDHDDQLTRASAALGTASYMPPEQVSRKNGEVGPWSDVYGLGATLYHLLTGRPPFAGDTTEETIFQVLADPLPRPRSLHPEIPMALEGIVVKCLAKNPKDRYQTMAALIADLNRYEAGERPEAPLLTLRRRVKLWAKRHRSGLAAALAVVLLVVGAGAVGVQLAGPGKLPDPEPREEYKKELAAGRPVTLVGEKGLPRWHRWAFGATALAEDPRSGDACYFETIENSMLELMTDPGIDRYEVRADLCLLRQRLPAAVTNLTGLYFGHATPDGVSHAFLAATYNDFLDPVARQAGMTKAVTQLRRVYLRQRPDGTIDGPTGGASKAIRFTPAPKLPGEWRRFRAEITPERVRVFWAAEPDNTPDDQMALLADLSAADLAGLVREQRAAIDKVRPGMGRALPEWHPRLPLGIWCRGGAVAVKNVIVTPLPPSP